MTVYQLMVRDYEYCEVWTLQFDNEKDFEINAYVEYCNLWADRHDGYDELFNFFEFTTALGGGRVDVNGNHSLTLINNTFDI